MIRPGTLALLWLTVGLGCVPDPGRTERSASEYLRVLGAEDRRPRGGPDLELLLSAPRHPAVTVRRAAVRALGRLENPSLVDRIVPSLADASPTVRAAAASALAQAVHGTSAGGGVLQSLLDRASVESEPIVRGALARSLGRLRLTRPERRRALNGVLRLGRTPDGGRPPTEAMVGVALGLESLVRGSGGDGLSSEAADRLEELLSHSEDAGLEAEAARVRSLALSALAAARRLTLELVVQGLDDPSPEVRRLAARHLDVVVPSRRVDLIRQAIHDGSPRVALEVVRFLARGPRDDERCEILLAAAAAERPPAVRVAALAALGTPCPGIDQGSALRDEAGSLDADPRAWHVPTQALRSLARVDPTAAGRLLPGYIAHPNPLVRAHAARAATALRDRQALMTLTSDPSANVRTATLEGL